MKALNNDAVKEEKKGDCNVHEEDDEYSMYIIKTSGISIDDSKSI